jgi:hypothetical protein
MNDRLKKIIFNKLNEDLSHVEIILHNDSLWFIDRENKYWYLEFQKGGKLYWRYQFFAKFFPIFTLERDDYEELIKEWVESVLNCGVTTTLKDFYDFDVTVESVLNCGVTTTTTFTEVDVVQVESVLNCGVTTTSPNPSNGKFEVESVLNGGIKYVISADRTFDDVEMVLNNENK